MPRKVCAERAAPHLPQSLRSSLGAPAGGVLVLLSMQGIALTGAWIDKERGLLSLIALELGVSSRLVAYLRKGEPVVVMGPTGSPTEIRDKLEKQRERTGISYIVIQGDDVERIERFAEAIVQPLNGR